MRYFSFVIALLLLCQVSYASDPIAVKRGQVAVLRQQILLKQQQMASLKKQGPQKNIKLASLVQKQVQQNQVRPQQNALNQKKTIDLSSFAIRPMQAWKDELKVPSTSNDGIEVIPHAVN